MITLLYGENEFAVFAEQRARIAVFLAAYDEYGLERIDGEIAEPNAIGGAVLQLPFLASKKLVIIRSIFASKSSCDKLLEILPNIPSEVDVLLVDPRADKRTKLFKTLQSAKQTVEFKNLTGSSLEKWIVGYAAEIGGVVSPADASYLVARVGLSQIQLAREVEKLSIQGQVTRLMIDELTDMTLDASVFDLLDAVFSGSTDAAMAVYDQLVGAKTDPIEIMGLMGWQLHLLAAVKYAGPGSPQDVARATGLSPYSIGKALNIVRSMTVDDVKHAVRRALETDVLIKTTPVNSVDAVRVLLLELAN
jgi:DNA polymerase III delta subunit